MAIKWLLYTHYLEKICHIIKCNSHALYILFATQWYDNWSEGWLEYLVYRFSWPPLHMIVQRNHYILDLLLNYWNFHLWMLAWIFWLRYRLVIWVVGGLLIIMRQLIYPGKVVLQFKSIVKDDIRLSNLMFRHLLPFFFSLW